MSITIEPVHLPRRLVVVIVIIVAITSLIEAVASLIAAF